jgi:hypothetical protein
LDQIDKHIDQMFFAGQGSQVRESPFVSDGAMVQQSETVANPFRFIESMG